MARRDRSICKPAILNRSDKVKFRNPYRGHCIKSEQQHPLPALYSCRSGRLRHSHKRIFKLRYKGPHGARSNGINTILILRRYFDLLQRNRTVCLHSMQLQNPPLPQHGGPVPGRLYRLCMACASFFRMTVVAAPNARRKSHRFPTARLFCLGTSEAGSAGLHHW